MADDAVKPSSSRAKSEITVLGPKDKLVGTLTVEGDVQILGTVEGEIIATGDIEVENSARLKARLEGRDITIRGNVQGDVTAHQRLLLADAAILTGDAKVGRLTVQDGATLNGSIAMQGPGSGSTQPAPAAATAGGGPSSPLHRS